MGIGYRAFFGGRLQTAGTIARETTPRDGRRGGEKNKIYLPTLITTHGRAWVSATGHFLADVFRRPAP